MIALWSERLVVMISILLYLLRSVLFPILIFGIFSLFAQVFPYLHGFTYLWSLMLLTLELSFCVDILFVDVDPIPFYLLIFLLPV